jgi:hypothetical protein
MIRSAALQDEAAVAVAAVNIFPIINFQPDTRVAKGSPSGNIAGPITRNAALGHSNGFGRVIHGLAVSKGRRMKQLLVVENDRERARIVARSLAGTNAQCRAKREIENSVGRSDCETGGGRGDRRPSGGAADHERINCHGSAAAHAVDRDAIGGD